MTYRYEVESDTPLVLFSGIANRPTIVPTSWEQEPVGGERTEQTVTMRRVE